MALRRKKHDGNNPGRKLPVEHNGMYPYLAQFIEASRRQGLTEATCVTRESGCRRFIAWCDERGLDRPHSITKPILERYQTHLYYYRKTNGEPLSVSMQLSLVASLKAWFRWLTRQNHILYNPASELELPRKLRRLPRHILSIDEINQVLALPDVGTPEGVRDRAMLEVLYSTGIRRMELCHLRTGDIHIQRGILFVREGKGRADRYVPIGERALAWVEKYCTEVRPLLVVAPDDGTLFLTAYGAAFELSNIGMVVKKYLRKAGIAAVGSCHLFRHAMATHMLENGADIRFIQALLGHRDLTTTEVYTRVSLEKLKQIHAATHPAKLKAHGHENPPSLDEREALLLQLDEEGADDDE